MSIADDYGWNEGNIDEPLTPDSWVNAKIAPVKQWSNHIKAKNKENKRYQFEPIEHNYRPGAASYLGVHIGERQMTISRKLDELMGFPKQLRVFVDKKENAILIKTSFVSDVTPYVVTRRNHGSPFITSTQIKRSLNEGRFFLIEETEDGWVLQGEQDK